MNAEFIMALSEIARTKGMSEESLIETIETALIAAYKKNYGQAQNVFAHIDRETGDIRVHQQREVVEEVEDPDAQIGLEEARAISPIYNTGDFVDFEATPRDFGRIAAQTAKQVVVQRIKEAERSALMETYQSAANSLVTGVIMRADRRNVLVQIANDTEAVLPQNEQLASERYTPGARFKFYVAEVKASNGGPQIVLSRTHPNLVRKLFEQETPEIEGGVVEIKSISREAGSRSKIAVYSADENVDPIGSCVGQKGKRVQQVCDALGGEKIDVIRYSDDPVVYIKEALSPSDVVRVTVDEEAHTARVIVPENQLSLAIGKEGQNVRLAARLTTWKIDIKSENAPSGGQPSGGQ
jgi:N utilization substance protein A